MGSAYRGRRCAIIRYMMGCGPVGEDEIVRRLGIGPTIAHDVLGRMTEEGVLFCMGRSDEKRFYLTDRHGWVDGKNHTNQ